MLKIPDTGNHTVVWTHEDTAYTGTGSAATVWTREDTVHTMEWEMLYCLDM